MEVTTSGDNGAIVYRVTAEGTKIPLVYDTSYTKVGSGVQYEGEFEIFRDLYYVLITRKLALYAEIDTDFNVNVVTGSDGTIMGASGGHNDTAAGSKISIVVTNLLKGRLCVLRDHVTTVTSPGETIDALVTDRGIAINPRRTDLLEKLKDSKLPIMDIQKLKEIGDKLAGKPDPIEFTDRIVGVVEYRDGTVIDVVRQPK